MINRTIRLVMIASILGVLSPPLSAEPAAPKTEPAKASAGLRVDAKARRIEIDATVANSNRVLEYLLVVAGEGPEYESLLSTHSTTQELHLALLMIGLIPNDRAPSFGRGDRREVSGEKVDVWIEWPVTQGVERKRIETVLRYTTGPDRVDPAGWAFLPFLSPTATQGDGAGGAKFHAGTTGNLISLLHDPYSVLTHPTASELTPRELMPRKAMPTAGTAVTLILEPVSETALIQRTEQDTPARNELMKWAQQIDDARADWKKQDAALSHARNRYEQVKRDTSKAKEAYQLFREINRTKPAVGAATARILRAQQELVAVHFAQTAKPLRAKPKPNPTTLGILDKRQEQLDKQLTYLRLFDERETDNNTLAELQFRLDALEGTGHGAQAQTLRAERERLSAKAELLDIQLNLIQYRRQIEAAEEQIKELLRQITFYREAITNAESELKTLQVEQPAPKNQEK